MSAMTTLPAAASVSERQVAALRAGLVLLDQVAGTAELYLTINRPMYDSPADLDALVGDRGGEDETSEAATDAARLADLRAAAVALGAPLTEFHAYHDGVTVSVAARIVIDGVEVRVWTALTDPDAIAVARALVPADTPTGAVA